MFFMFTQINIVLRIACPIQGITECFSSRRAESEGFIVPEIHVSQVGLGKLRQTQKISPRNTSTCSIGTKTGADEPLLNSRKSTGFSH